jgi:putative peptidoglycan lipid II flippase
LTVLLGLFASPILQAIASGFDAQKLELTRTLFLILLPGVIIYGAASLWSGVLNAEHRFGIPAVIPVITPLFIGLTSAR